MKYIIFILEVNVSEHEISSESKDDVIICGDGKTDNEENQIQ